MGIVIVVAAMACAGSLAAGLVARIRLGRQPAGTAADPGAAAPAPARDAPGDPATWRYLARVMLAPERGITRLALVLTISDTALSLAAPWPLQLVVDYGLGGRRFPAWIGWLAGLRPIALACAAALAGLLLLGAGALAGYQVTYLTGVLSERMTLRLRVRLVAHLMRVAPAAVTRHPLGELTSRVGADVWQVSDTLGAVIETVVPDLALLAGMTVITAMIDWRLTLVVGGLVPLYALTARLRNRSLRGAQRLARARSGELSALAADQLGRLPAVAVFDQGTAEARRHAVAAGLAADAAVAALDASARFRPVNDLLPGLGLAAALVAGTVEVTSGRLTVGGLLVFVAYLSSLTTPVRSLSALTATIARGSVSRDRVAELLRLPPLETGQASAGPHRRASLPAGGRRGASVRFEQVSYAHREGEPVLDRVSLLLPAGQLTCLTGPSGAGKSTLLSLLVRLADPQQGQILIDDRDIAGLPLSDLRRLVTLVPQEPWLHAGTIAENIGYGSPGATRAQVIAAAGRAGVSAFARGLPDGYDTPAGEHGGQLSVGQRRRVAVARALLRDAPVLLLDEPTAGLDPATEADLVRELLEATIGQTVLLVTHQPDLARVADQELALDGGILRARPVPPATRPLARATR